MAGSTSKKVASDIAGTCSAPATASGSRVRDGDVALIERPRFAAAGAAEQVAGGLAAPMPGKIISVEVTTGQDVAAGQLLLILEAMKMEHRVLAPRDGVVGEIRAAAGDQVGGGDLLVVLEEAK